MDFILADNRKQKKTVITPNTAEQNLFTAIGRGDIDLVKTLVQSGVNPQCLIEGWNPLTVACELNKEHILEFLINLLQKEEEETRNLKEEKHICHTPFIDDHNGHARLGRLDIVKILSQAGCDINIANKYGVTPLYESVHKGHFSVSDFNGWRSKSVKLLFTAGADLRLRTQQGLTALHLAMEMNRYQVVEYFLTKGANILKKPHSDNSLKSIASVFERKNIETVEVLLRYCPNLPLHHYPGLSDIFSENGKLLKLLFLSGIKTMPGVLTIPRLHPFYVQDKDLSQWLKDYQKNPSSLKSLCRTRQYQPIKLREITLNQDKILYQREDNTLPDRGQHFTKEKITLSQREDNTLPERGYHFTRERITLYQREDNTLQERGQHFTRERTTLYQREDNTLPERGQHFTRERTTLYQREDNTLPERGQHFTRERITLYQREDNTLPERG
ncbi:ANK [Mytilus edulis]|uniref:ANK n=1 Tax=Mytilus edulis TaxID=6550 RepID=A0A8S3Q0C6_MYTED|nr:ANK [Mytilus edulis]